MYCIGVYCISVLGNLSSLGPAQLESWEIRRPWARHHELNEVKDAGIPVVHRLHPVLSPLNPTYPWASHPELNGVEDAGVPVAHRLHPVPALREQRGDIARDQVVAALAPARQKSPLQGSGVLPLGEVTPHCQGSRITLFPQMMSGRS